MSVTFKQDPNDVEYRTFQWKLWLEGASIASSTIAVNDPALVVVATTVGIDSVTVYLSGGVENNLYTVTNHVVTDSVPAREADAVLKIKIVSVK